MGEESGDLVGVRGDVGEDAGEGFGGGVLDGGGHVLRPFGQAGLELAVLTALAVLVLWRPEGEFVVVIGVWSDG